MSALKTEPRAAAEPPLMTVEELEQMSDDDNHYELVRGLLLRLVPPNFSHGNIVGRLAYHIQGFLDKNEIAEICIETGFILARHPDIVRGPDLSVVLRPRLEGVDLSRGFFPGAPDLAVEVVSLGDTHDEVADKVEDYLALGVRLVWVVRPTRRTVAVHRPGEAVRILAGDDALDGGDVLPGFVLPLTKLFRA